MKRLALLLLAFAALGQVSAQTQAPRFQGADVDYFMRRIIGEVEKIAVEKEIPATEFSARVIVAFTVDTEGKIQEWRFLDNTSEGRDHSDLDPVTERTREVLTLARERLDGNWTPASKDGQAEDYNLRLTLRIPVEKIAKLQDPDPLLFLDENPDKSFHAWASPRLRFDERFAERGAEGVVRVRFYIEPDGKITIGDVIKSTDGKLTKEMIRVIKSSKGKWTPRKVRGVPQRTAYVYGVNFLNN